MFIVDGRKSLGLQLEFDRKCVVSRLFLRGREVLLAQDGICSGMVVSGSSYASHSATDDPDVTILDNTATLAGIKYNGGGVSVVETWTLTSNADHIRWRIDRSYLSGGGLEETFSPRWHFAEISMWTGALLGNGGVAWFRLFDSTYATYGVHTDKVTFWNKDRHECLRVTAVPGPGTFVAMKFSRLPDDALIADFFVTHNELAPKYDPGLNRRRFLPDRQDVWRPFTVLPSVISVEFVLSAPDFDQEYGRGDLKGLNGESISSLAQTIARVGVVDSNLHGSNSWRTPYGPVVLHEQWIAQIGLVVEDADYFDAYKRTLDNFRDNAIQADGRVKPRWAYTCEDAMPGTCDDLGFYEARWGYLLDSNPDYVTNVAELFDFTGDDAWVRGHKSACEQALGYMIARDLDGDGLVEMINELHSDGKGSDWIDVIWAAYKNAFVNAKMYWALSLWADMEEQLGDSTRADYYRGFAEKLKTSFNKPTKKGGLWDPGNRWYIHWRDKDDSIHGNNLVTFVNFMAIAYGLCDSTRRRNAILESIEQQMKREKLFWWPLCMYPYSPEEGQAWQFPFPKYENGDIFLSSGELGVRAYKDYDPAIPVNYIRQVLKKYESDGLAFQRYERMSQKGTGDDILAGNCMPVVGLYRDIYGVQPKFNRLYFEPHISPDLSGTHLRYRWRNQVFTLDITAKKRSIGANKFVVNEKMPFAVFTNEHELQYFHGIDRLPSLSIRRSVDDLLQLTIVTWNRKRPDLRKWIESSQRPDMVTDHTVSHLKPDKTYRLSIDKSAVTTMRSDPSGQVQFTYRDGYPHPKTFEVRET